MGVLAKIVAGVAFAVGVMQAIVGVISIGENFNSDWCKAIKNSAPLTDIAQNSCITPLLMWNTETKFTQDVNGPPSQNYNQNSEPALWRDFFTFEPDRLADIWTPMIFGVLSVSLHFGHTRWDAISGNWIVFMIYLVVQSLWGSIGYAGNIGVITGFLGFFCAFLCVICAWFDALGDRCLDLSSLLPCLKAHAVSPRARQEDP